MRASVEYLIGDSRRLKVHLVEFTVLNIDVDRTRQKSRYVMADAQVLWQARSIPPEATMAWLTMA